MKIQLGVDLPARRAKAIARVNDHFNQLALKSAHFHFVSIATGNTTELLCLEARRLSLIARAESANSIDALDQIIRELEP